MRLDELRDKVWELNNIIDTMSKHTHNDAISFEFEDIKDYDLFKYGQWLDKIVETNDFMDIIQKAIAQNLGVANIIIYKEKDVPIYSIKGERSWTENSIRFKYSYESNQTEGYEESSTKALESCKQCKHWEYEELESFRSEERRLVKHNEFIGWMPEDHDVDKKGGTGVWTQTKEVGGQGHWRFIKWKKREITDQIKRVHLGCINAYKKGVPMNPGNVIDSIRIQQTKIRRDRWVAVDIEKKICKCRHPHCDFYDPVDGINPILKVVENNDEA